MGKEPTVYVFIDASNIWEVQKARGLFLDLEKLRNYIRRHFHSTNVTVFYYTAYPADETRMYSTDPKHKFFTFLEKGLDFTVRKKQLKRISAVGEEGEYVKEKGDMDVEVSVDAMHHIGRYDTAVFFTGDSDFLPLITYLRSTGKRVYVYSSRRNVSHELRTGGDGYTDILEIPEDIWGRRIRHRKERRKEH